MEVIYWEFDCEITMYKGVYKVFINKDLCKREQSEGIKKILDAYPHLKGGEINERAYK